MIIKETRRVYSRWVLDEEVNDRSLLGEELNEYCAQYTMYHVTEKWEQVTAEQTGRTSPNRVRRQSGSGLNGTKLCRGGMDLNSALQVCPEPKMKCNERFMCSQINRCADYRPRRQIFSLGLFGHGWGSWGCFSLHDTRKIIECCNYVCNNVDNPTTETVENIGSEVFRGRL
ncbi:uncharacterized protein LOC111325615 [Stylophora pistillata]|uniref:uncharacterized protein LOC111325615 n=1 Tax=Stylophora pistillata TaxID=50429 RepID=UPI000C0502A6|nr:uncharacterized protein LOC111325615 [Stylophora pistillata]